MQQASVLFESAGNVGIVTLNRPEALNALSPDMLERLRDGLHAWENDPAIRVVLLRGAGGKAFCAGGDVRAVYHDRRDGGDSHTAFFETEYRLNHALWRYAKPIVALMDGIVMGGGMGIAQPATLRLATERTRVAMPETAIGLVPDVAGSFFLSRMAPQLSRYLGLSGATLGAADACYCGLADGMLAEGGSPQIVDALQAIDWHATGTAEARTLAVRGAIAPLTRPVGEPGLAALAAPLLEHFSKPDVSAIMASLAEAHDEHAEWAASTLDTLRQRSPLSLRVVDRQLALGRRLDLADCLRLEYNLVIQAVAEGDFMEGVRALLVDKDKRPRWQAGSVEQVADADVAAFFARRLDDPTHPLADLR